MAGRKLARDLEGSLAEQIEKVEAGGRPERLTQAPGRVGDRVVAELGHRGQVGEQRIEVRCGVHCDVIMTSVSHLSSVTTTAVDRRTHVCKCASCSPRRSPPPA